MTTDIRDKILQARKLINKGRFPSGLVAHPSIEALIKAHKEIDVKESEDGNFPPKLIPQVMVYSFEDVPKDKTVIFYDRQQLVQYLLCRQKGMEHYEALGEIIFEHTDVDDLLSDLGIKKRPYDHNKD